MKLEQSRLVTRPSVCVIYTEEEEEEEESTRYFSTRVPTYIHTYGWRCRQVSMLQLYLKYVVFELRNQSRLDPERLCFVGWMVNYCLS